MLTSWPRRASARASSVCCTDSPPTVCCAYSGARTGRLWNPSRQIFILRASLSASCDPAPVPARTPLVRTAHGAHLPVQASRRTLATLHRCAASHSGGSMETRKAVDYLRDHVRKYGFGATLHELQCRLINKVVHFEIIKGMTVRTRDVKDPSLFEAPGFDGRFVDEGELREYAQDVAHQMPPESLRTPLARGDRCYALFDGGTLAAYGWYSDLSSPLDDHFVL